ncbi:hypothetical protein V5O48_010047 [Marasmius crinis-equi]|uniref:Uncharacterized protein n=1 Tax=Marasmius crinis-equi TaxID=585013 RepID=A0ABR3F9K5_9AGAR
MPTLTNDENVNAGCLLLRSTDEGHINASRQTKLDHHPAYTPGNSVEQVKISRPRPLPRKQPIQLNELETWERSSPFADYTNTSGSDKAQNVDERDEGQIATWMKGLRLSDHARDSVEGHGKEKDRVEAKDGGEETELLEENTVDEVDRATPTPCATPHLRSRFSDDFSSHLLSPEFPLKPIASTDMTPPTFTDPFSDTHKTFGPLPPLTSEDYIDLPDVFLQPGGYKEPSSSSSNVLPPPPSPKMVFHTKEISPFDTSEMTPADFNLRGRILSNLDSKPKPRSWSVRKHTFGAAFRARQREIRARKASHSKPAVPPRPKRSLALPDVRFRKRSSDAAASGTSSRFGSFVRRVLPEPNGMVRRVLRR